MSSPPPKTKLIECPSRKSPYIKWGHFVDGGNGYLYGIPHYARQVLEMNIEDKSIKSIGPLLTNVQYWSGIRADNGSIYCIPDGIETDYFLKITPKEEEGVDAEVKILADRPLPESGYNWWREGVLAKDGCIYYLPFEASNVLKLDPSCGDSLSLVGDEFESNLFEGAVLGENNCIYGTSEDANIKFDPTKNSVLKLVSGCFDEHDCCYGYGGVLAADGNIYTSNACGQIVKIDTAKNCYTLIGNAIINYDGPCFGLPVLGADKCIYFPPHKYDCVLQFNPITHSMSFVGDSYKVQRWYGGALASDGFIYYASYFHQSVLQVDARPLNEIILEFVQKSIG